jgi:hypothetical protein
MTTARSSPPDESRPALARLAELALVVPIEVSSRLIEAIPAVVDKVPAAAGRVKREVVLARFLGKMVVDQGVREIRVRMHPVETVSPAVIGEGHRQRDEVAPDATPSAGAAIVAHPVEDDPPGVATLALADYDHLSSAQVVGKLDGLDENERDAIERYERAGRHRRTILGKLDQLRSAAQ